MIEEILRRRELGKDLFEDSDEIIELTASGNQKLRASSTDENPESILKDAMDELGFAAACYRGIGWHYMAGFTFNHAKIAAEKLVDIRPSEFWSERFDYTMLTAYAYMELHDLLEDGDFELQAINRSHMGAGGTDKALKDMAWAFCRAAQANFGRKTREGIREGQRWLKQAELYAQEVEDETEIMAEVRRLRSNYGLR